MFSNKSKYLNGVENIMNSQLESSPSEFSLTTGGGYSLVDSAKKVDAPSSSDEEEGSNHLSLDLDISDGRKLISSFVTFFKNDGFFIETDKSFSLGDVVKLSVKMPSGSKERYSVNTKVVWIVPKNAEDRRTQGVGLSIEDDSSSSLELREKINAYLSKRVDKVKKYAVFPFPS
ncbi:MULTISPECIES: PilZ domain-containing protein [Candidatus Ichthyocystis]|uniref:PilZ domain-containing protein n=1 Tax=Candidatus Ichthyocystis TaxID=2929841 RepID=UPI0012FE5305|nr:MULTISPECIES: PilZ domain-containing protein [Ichthyocystis]